MGRESAGTPRATRFSRGESAEGAGTAGRKLGKAMADQDRSVTILDDTLDVVERVARESVLAPSLEEYGVVTYIGQGIARVQGLPNVQSEELVRFEGDRLGHGLQPGSGRHRRDPARRCPEGLESGSEVRRTHRVLDTPVGEALLGRVVDPLGRPLDDAGPVQTHAARRRSSAMLRRSWIARRSRFRWQPGPKWSMR